MYSTFKRNYNMNLPLYVTKENTKKPSFFSVVDYSQYLFGLTGLFGSIGIITNSIEGESFDIVLNSTMAISSIVAWYRVRRLGEAKTVMESVDDLKLQNDNLEQTQNELEIENDELKITNDKLAETETKLTGDINDLRILVGIFGNNNMTSEEIQVKLLSSLKQLEKENKKHEKLNKGQAFLIADANKDGKLTGNEIEVLQDITLDDISRIDKNKDKKITKDEYLNS